jgi:tyrosinase
MATYTRANAWNNRGTFDNKDLYWYAIGVRAMMDRALNDPASWWFFAAIHGEYVTPDNDPGKFPGWGYIPGVPKVPTTPLPTPNVVKIYWNQCQHQSWFFPPWHRGYLVALEAQLREDIVQAKGPTNWALPYWDYFGPGDEFDIPPAFTQQNMPNGSPNPLFVTARYGPYANNIVFDPTAMGLKKYPPPPNFHGVVTEKCLSNSVYTGSDSNTPLPGFGGPLTGFWHGDVYPSGNLEQDPHNLTHVFVGGSVSDTVYGLMSDPGLAALDPIFYLHHANIDRMWAVWNSNSSHNNPSDPNWLKGPAASGEREFIMPMPGKKSWRYIPKDVNSLSQMDYTYENLKQVPVVDLLALRLSRLGIRAVATPGAAAESVRNSVELVGANDGPMSIRGSGASTTVQLDTEVRQKVAHSLSVAAENSAPDRVYLNLENVRGTHDATALSIFINLPEGSNPGDHPDLLAGTVALFGLRRASLADGKHVGGGLSFLLDISAIVDRMHLDNALNTDNLRVMIVPNRPVSDNAQITVERVSIYREGPKR